MSALIKAPRRAAAALPVQAVADLAEKIRELVRIPGKVEDHLIELESHTGHQGRLAPPPGLPDHTERTIALAVEMSKPPAAKNILDALSVLAGVYGARGNAEIIASVGVELIQAERPSRMALYAATVALLRPVPGERPSSKNDWNGVPDMPRKFAPTLSEFIAELREQQRNWQCLTSRIAALPERYAKVRH